MTRPKPERLGGMILTPSGTWWDLTLSQKVTRWLKIVPAAWVKSLLHAVPCYKANREFELSLKETQKLLFSLYTSKLDRQYAVAFVKNKSKVRRR